MAGSRQHRTRLVHASPKKLDAVRSEINVTPLVDVCLVLLIIFMVVTPMMSRGKDVPLPKAKNPVKKDDRGQQPILSISKTSSGVAYMFDKDLVNDRADASAVEQLKKLSGDALGKAAKSGITSIYVKADANLTFGEIRPALMALHEAGSQGVQLATAEDSAGEAP